MLIDASAWIEFFRRGGQPAVKDLVVRALEAQEAEYACPTLHELVAGARSQRERKAVDATLSVCRRVPVVEEDWIRAGECEARMRTAGRKVQRYDIMLAVVAARTGRTILTCDSDFAAIRDIMFHELKLEGTD
jgi:predicted nucleic acid-binding protein